MAETNLNGFLNAISSATGGQEVVLKPGKYNLDEIGRPLILNKNFPKDNKLRVICEGVEFINEDKNGQSKYRTTVDIKGTGYNWQGGKARRGKESIFMCTGGGSTLDGIEMAGERAVVTGLFLAGTDQEVKNCKIHGMYGRTSLGIEGNGGNQNENGRIIFGFPKDRTPLNWKIHGNEIYNIETTNYGMHEGAMKLVPGAYYVDVYNNHVHDIIGQGLWMDRFIGDCRIFDNKIERVSGKSIFVEISDLHKNANYGALIFDNVIREGGKHGILVAASSYCEVVHNDIEAWLALVIHAMPRDFYIDLANKELGKKDAQLWHNRYAFNKLKSHFHKSSIAIYNKQNGTDPNAGDNSGHTNYYAINHVAGLNGHLVDRPYFNFSDSKGLNHITDITLVEADPTGMAGNNIDIDQVPIFGQAEAYLENLYKGIPNMLPMVEPGYGNTGGSGGNNGGGNNGGGNNGGGNNGGGNQEPGAGGKPRVIVASDFAPPEKADADNWVYLAACLLSLNLVELEALIIGQPQPAGVDIENLFWSTLGKAYEEERDNLGYGIDLPVWKADTNEKRFASSPPVPQDFAGYPVVEEIVSILEKGKTLCFNGGILTEYAKAAQWLDTYKPELLENFVIISHATAPASQNNCRRDKEACAYLHQLAKGALPFYELGLSGARVIDDRTAATGEINGIVLNSKIGRYFDMKFLDFKPDFSDYMAWAVALFSSIFGEGYLETLKDDGTDNMAKINADFKAAGGKQILYTFLEDRARLAINGGGSTGGGNTGGGGNNGGGTGEGADLTKIITLAEEIKAEAEKG